jgi:hypothetical protein
MPKAASHPMREFMRKTLTLEEIYDFLLGDFRRDGKRNVHPDTTFYDPPPTGMGYSGALAMQSFLNTYVNSKAGKARYNLAPVTNIFVTQVPAPKCVGNLSALIFAKQQ